MSGLSIPLIFKDQFGVEGKIVLLTFGLAVGQTKVSKTYLNALPKDRERVS